MKVAVLMGGRSAEHEISLVSGREVCLRAEKRKFQIYPVVIEKSGGWKKLTLGQLEEMPDPVSESEAAELFVEREGKLVRGVGALRNWGVEVVFIALHGPFGEDGCVQGMLEIEGLKYTGPGVLASALGMDKLRFGKVVSGSGIEIPKRLVVEKKSNLRQVSRILGELPYVVKPHNQGSSVGVSLVRRMAELREAFELARHYSETVLVEECVNGVEVTAAVMGNGEPKALPLVEIVPKRGDFFDYGCKYRDGADEIVPARLARGLAKRVQRVAVEVYKVVGARGFSRIDFILRDGGGPVVLEINTIPGLTPLSLFPKAAQAAGISYPQLSEHIGEYALE